jgi:hypothetical protein
MENIKNAIIESASITNGEAGQGVLTVWLRVKYGDGFSQGFGGLPLYLPKSFTHHRIASPAGHFINRCMEIAGVTEWKDMVGKAIRVEATHVAITAIGHITKEDWFDPKIDFCKE